jgi:hypothetical protein
MPMEPRSLFGNAARMCVDAAAGESYPRRRKGPRRPSIGRPQPCDAVKHGTCKHCGLVGEHPTLFACIDALRSELARRE